MRTSRSPRAPRPRARGTSHDRSAYAYEATSLERHWAKLHLGDREPFPGPDRVARLTKRNRDFRNWLDAQGGPAPVAEGLQNAWRAFHGGDFGAAIELGETLGALGATAANKAAGVHATYLEKNTKRAIEILEVAMQRGEAAVETLPDEPNAHYMLAFVLGRYGQRISIVKALAAGVAGRIRAALERTLELEPRHADAHVAFGVYHAAIVSQVGSLVARLTYGASREAAIEHFEQALKLAPHSAIARLEYADALLLLDQRADRDRVRTLYHEAALSKPMDAMEALDVERAKQGSG